MNAAAVGLDDLALKSVRCVANRAPHNAFCDLLPWREGLWLVYREGADHVSPDGVIRVLSSVDGLDWREAMLLASPDEDLRDPKLSATLDGRLMLLAAATVRNEKGHLRKLRNLAWFSEDGARWDGPHAVAEAGIWLWRVRWHEGTGYGIGYSCLVPGAPGRFVRLYRTRDGLDFEVHVAVLNEGGYPNEHDLVFQPDGSAHCLLRCDDQRDTALLGRAEAPYLDWQWRELGRPVGGPALIRLPSGEIAAGVRLYEGGMRTALCRLDPEKGLIEERIALPSGGDTSYPGLAWQAGGLWMAYYSEHEGNCRVYLARFEPKAGP